MDVLPQFRQRLDLHRRAGASFLEAWKASLVDVGDAEWLRVLAATRAAWEAAYEGRPQPVAVRALVAVVADSGREPYSGLDCAHCEGPIPVGRGDRAGRPVLYCSDQCRRRASWDRVAA